MFAVRPTCVQDSLFKMSSESPDGFLETSSTMNNIFQKNSTSITAKSGKLGDWRTTYIRNLSGYGVSQWETMLQCNISLAKPIHRMICATLCTETVKLMTFLLSTSPLSIADWRAGMKSANCLIHHKSRASLENWRMGWGNSFGSVRLGEHGQSSINNRTVPNTGQDRKYRYTWLCFVLLWLTHWGRVTHICVSKLTIIGSDNGLLPDRRHAIIWTNAEILLIGSLGTNFSEILIEILTFSFKKMHLKVSSAKRRLFCLGLNVLTHWPLGDLDVILKIWFSIWFNWLLSSDLCMIMSSDNCHRSDRTLLMISQHWFRYWLGAFRQQAITWACVDQDPCRHMVS